MNRCTNKVNTHAQVEEMLKKYLKRKFTEVIVLFD